MQKRKILATAGAVTITTVAATAALGTNLGLFGLTAEDANGPGHLAPVGPAASAPTRTPTERTEVVDVSMPYYVSDGSTDSPGTPPADGTAGGSPVGSCSAASGPASGGGPGFAPSANAPVTSTAPAASSPTQGGEIHAAETHDTQAEHPESSSTEASIAGAHE